MTITRIHEQTEAIQVQIVAHADTTMTGLFREFHRNGVDNDLVTKAVTMFGVANESVTFPDCAQRVAEILAQTERGDNYSETLYFILGGRNVSIYSSCGAWRTGGH